MHKAQAILNAFKASLAPLITNNVVKVILPNNAQPAEVHPALIVRMGEEDVSARNMSNFDNRDLNIYIDIYVHSKNTDLDEQVLVIREEVEKAILANVQLGLPFVLNTEFNGQDAPDYQGDAELYAAAIRLNFVVKYRTQSNNPSL